MRTSPSAAAEQHAKSTIRADALRQGEFGLQRPLGANVPGPDFFTAVREVDAAGRVRALIYVNDVKVSGVPDFPTPATAAKASWLAELREALSGELTLGDAELEQAIRDAVTPEGWNVYARQVDIDMSAGVHGSERVTFHPGTQLAP
jgi:hypothetical protein